MATELDLSPAYWQGLMQPLAAASTDPSDQAEAAKMLKDRTKLKNGDAVSFMLGWHQMLNTGIKLPKIEAKASPEKEDDMDWRNPKKRTKATPPIERTHEHPLHNLVRAALAVFNLEVDMAPRAPKRVGYVVTYYLARDYEGQLVSEIEAELRKLLHEWYPENVGTVVFDGFKLQVEVFQGTELASALGMEA